MARAGWGGSSLVARKEGEKDWGKGKREGGRVTRRAFVRCRKRGMRWGAKSEQEAEATFLMK